MKGEIDVNKVGPLATGLNLTEQVRGKLNGISISISKSLHEDIQYPFEKVLAASTLQKIQKIHRAKIGGLWDNIRLGQWPSHN